MSKLTVSIPDDLHQKIREELEKQGITTSQFIEQAVTNFFENPKGDNNMATRTLAFQVSEELFQRVKAYLARYEEIHHRRLSQKEFVIGLIEAELAEADEEFEAAEIAAETENLEMEQAAEEPETDESADEDNLTMDEDLQTKIGQLLTKRKQLPKTAEADAQREQISDALRQLRQEKRLCRKIAEHSIEVQEHLTEARRDRAEQQQREQERDRRPDIALR